jgi:hypothetical protein
MSGGGAGITSNSSVATGAELRISSVLVCCLGCAYFRSRPFAAKKDAAVANWSYCRADSSITKIWLGHFGFDSV